MASKIRITTLQKNLTRRVIDGAPDCYVFQYGSMLGGRDALSLIELRSVFVRECPSHMTQNSYSLLAEFRHDSMYHNASIVRVKDTKQMKETLVIKPLDATFVSKEITLRRYENWGKLFEEVHSMQGQQKKAGFELNWDVRVDAALIAE